jgi:outer membrane protein OmpA-like peptidoglycan-associated protein
MRRLEEQRQRQLKEAEDRRNRVEERRKRELADQEQNRRERAKQITGQQQDESRERRARRLDEGGERSLEERNERRRLRREFTDDTLGDVKRGRRERREGNRVIIEEPGNRRIIREGRRVIIEEDDSQRLRGGRDVKVEKGPRGVTRTVINRPNGVQIITVRNREGDVVRRIKKLRNGREIVLFNNEPRRKRARRNDRDGFSFFIDLPDLRIERPRRDYYVYADRADEDEIEDILSAEPLEAFEEEYTLDEIRYSPDIRARFSKLNVNTVNFDFGSWEIREDQFDKLEVVARVINRIIERDESEVFMLAGHTDLVGSQEDNLSLAGRRAETVARILTDEFGVPPENLVTQGYGESDPLVDTEEAEIANRRVEFMRITAALAQYDE